MTISTTSNQVTYTGDALSTAFAFPSPFITAADLKVYVNGVLQSTGYSVAGVAPTGGSGTFQSGTVTFSVAPAAAAVILIYCDPDQLQSVAFPPNDPFPAKTIEKAFDKLTLLIQRLTTKFGNAITYPAGDAANGVLPAASVRAGNLVSFDSLGNAQVVAPVAGTATALAIDLASSALSTKNSGQIGFAYGLGYAVGTIGRWLQDLGTSVGSSFIGFIQAGSGAVATLLQTWMRWRAVSAFDFMTAAQVADVQSFGYTLDVTAALTNWEVYCRANKRAMYAPAGGYLITNWLFGSNSVGSQSACAPVLFGDGQGTTFKLKAGTTGVGIAATNMVGTTLRDFIIDGNSTLAIPIDTSWTVGIGPSLDNTYSNIVVQNYDGAKASNRSGWKGQNNNDALFKRVHVRLPTGANPVAFDIQAPGGAVWMEDCIFSNAVLDLTCQVATLDGCWGHGVRFSRTVTGDNVVAINGGYIYGSADTGACISVDSPATAGHHTRQLTLNGTLLTPTVNGQSLFDVGLVGAINLNGVIDETTFTHNFFGANTVFKGASGRAKIFENGFSVVGTAPTFNTIASFDYIKNSLDLNGVVSSDYESVAFTPTWSATGTQPALGNGTLTGWVVRSGKLRTAFYKLTAGSTTTFGTGTYRFSLPDAEDTTASGVGQARFLDSGVNTYGGASYQIGGSLIELQTIATPVAVVGPTVPFTFGNTDVIFITHSYLAV